METVQRPLPQPTRITQPYWDAAREGRLVIQQCAHCKARQFFPREFARLPVGRPGLDRMQRQGRRVHLHHQPARRRRGLRRAGALRGRGDRPDEGVRMMANIVDSRRRRCASAAACGSASSGCRTISRCRNSPWTAEPDRVRGCYDCRPNSPGRIKSAPSEQQNNESTLYRRAGRFPACPASPSFADVGNGKKLFGAMRDVPRRGCQGTGPLANKSNPPTPDLTTAAFRKRLTDYPGVIVSSVILRPNGDLIPRTLRENGVKLAPHA